MTKHLMKQLKALDPESIRLASKLKKAHNKLSKKRKQELEELSKAAEFYAREFGGHVLPDNIYEEDTNT